MPIAVVVIEKPPAMPEPKYIFPSKALSLGAVLSVTQAPPGVVFT
jgi:hypothetical protein